MYHLKQYKKLQTISRMSIKNKMFIIIPYEIKEKNELRTEICNPNYFQYLDRRQVGLQGMVLGS
jgi:hypothetical protein